MKIISEEMTALDPQLHIAALERELHWAHLKIQSLTEALRRERIDKYGPRSETLSDLQLKLLDEEPGVTRDEVEAEARREPIANEPERERKHIRVVNGCRRNCYASKKRSRARSATAKLAARQRQ